MKTKKLRRSLLGQKELAFVLLMVFLFIVIRSIHFPYRLNFSSDQAKLSSAALEIYRTKKPALIGGAITSVSYQGRQVFVGPNTYYLQLLFLLPGNFDPIKSSFIFMIFCALMVFPLFYGLKLLAGQRVALVMVIVYTLLPYYINYTSFLWDPNFQFALLPLLFLSMGWFKFKGGFLPFFIISFLIGSLLQIHYYFLFPLVGLVIYYFLYLRLAIQYYLIFLLGLVLGLLPMIIFELRHDFYNLRTVMLYISHWDEVFAGKISVNEGNIHDLLNPSFFILLLLFSRLKIYLSRRLIFLFFLGLLILSLVGYWDKPTKGYGMAKDWNYLDEEKVHRIIVSQSLTDFNVMNLAYDTLADVQKYLLKKDGIKIDYYNYKENKYLFLVTDRHDFMDDPAYEIKTFVPAVVLKNWDINGRYKLYLIKSLKR